MEIEIIEPGSAGIFGVVGTRKAKIRVSVATKEVEPIEEPKPEIKPRPEPAAQRPDQETVGKKPEIEHEQKPKEPAETALGTNVDENGLNIAKDALENILALIPMEGTSVKATQSNGIISLDIEGDKSGLLIGRKGRTLDALQFIINKIVNKTLEKRTQVVVDSESYRKRRKEFLTQMALQMGAKAKRIKKPVATNLLYPHDRRVVHLALRDDNTLSTKSRGDGLFKKVIIIPKGQG